MFAQRTLPIAVFAALAAVTATAQAADVTLYGRVDTGLAYQNFFGDSDKSDSYALDSGLNTASRVGIQGKEQINPDWTVSFRLESRFGSDTGELKGNRLFEGGAQLSISNKQLGELAAGRIAGINSGSGMYDLQFYMDAFGGGTFGTAVAPVKSSRMDNMITYRSPMMSGLQLTLQHALKLDAVSDKDKGEEGKSSANRYWSTGLRYNTGGLNLVAVYEGTTWGKESSIGAEKDRQVITLGGSYRVDDIQFYLQTQYFNGVEKIDAMGTNDRKTNLKGYGIYAGTQVWFGLSSWQTMVYWRDYKQNNPATDVSYDGQSIGIATKYLYRPSKTVDIYIGGAYSQWDRVKADQTLTDKSFNVITGITKYF